MYEIEAALIFGLLGFILFFTVTHRSRRATLLGRLKLCHRGVWLALSTKNGSQLNTELTLRYMTRRLLPVSKNFSCQLSSDVKSCNSIPVEDLETLLVFLDGNVFSGLAVQRSFIPAAGNGLFALRHFQKGDLLCVYRGTDLSLKDVLKMKLEDKDYVMGGFGLNCHLDASSHVDVLARYINDNFMNRKSINTKFVKSKKYKFALVIALRNIEPGEELYASYGDSYWSVRGYSKKSFQV